MSKTYLTNRCLHCGEYLYRSRSPDATVAAIRDAEKKYCSKHCKAAHIRDAAIDSFIYSPKPDYTHWQGFKRVTTVIAVAALLTGCMSFGDRVSEARRAGQKCEGEVTLVAVQTDGDDERIELICKWED